MKQCPTCQEDFADKFGFCPVDGTPLNGFVAPAAVATNLADESATFSATPPRNEESSNGHAYGDGFAMGDGDAAAIASDPFAARGEFRLTILEETGLVRRLTTELRAVAHESELTWPEFKRDPAGFTKRMAAGYGLLVKKFFAQEYALPALLAPLCVLLLVTSAYFTLAFVDKCRIYALFGRQCDVVARNENEDLELIGMVPDTEIPKEQPTPDKGTAGMAKGKGGGSKPEQDKAHGGGGGGRQEQLPASFGKLPPASMTPQILSPNPHPPAIKNPSLPTMPTIQADPALFPPDTRPLPYGDPKSKSTELSSGPGKGTGIGDGTGSGVGPGEGKGYGPGRGENTGGGDAHYGGGGPGGGGGGAPEDYNRTFKQNEVTSKAVIIAKPDPGFTEEARKNNVTGLVRLRAILTASGSVSGVSVIKGLPDGLTERAISAAKGIRFRPAQKDGRAVSQYITLEYNFNIY
ncbi:MAG: energy transducer TonB [Acidobacteria bacterium]|nr:energy transducer TonB [Acidobacteriota bacterium]